MTFVVIGALRVKPLKTIRTKIQELQNADPDLDI